MKERINDEWNAILVCANFLSMLAAAAATAAAAVTAATTTIATVTTSLAGTSTGVAGVTAVAAVFASAVDADPTDETVCPAIWADSCSCYVFDDDVYLECPSPTMAELRRVLAAFTHLPVHSLSIYNLDRSATTIKADDFAESLRVRQLHISVCNINQLNEDSFRHVREQLQSLAIVSGKLQAIPHKTLLRMTSLRAVSFEANEIAELPNYSFYGLHLVRLSLKGNALSHVGENAFAGLEETLELADLSANRLTRFPMAAARRLRRLATLRLACNVIRAIADDGYSLLENLRHVDLGSNRFASVGEDAFRPLSQLRTLSLYDNGVEVMHRRAFASLAALEILDLSHNDLVHVEADTFRTNLRLRTVDLSHNHLHRIGGLFANLVELRELFLGENNVLEVPRDAFANATALDVLHLQRNAVRRIDERAFANDGNGLRQLRLSENFIRHLPPCKKNDGTGERLAGCANLVALYLDHNSILELQPAAFAAASAMRELRLHNNRIARIQSGVFEPLHQLVELHLQQNAIATIERGAFGSMRSLQYVNLRGNALRELGDIFWPQAASLVSLQLDANGLVALRDTALVGQTNVEVVCLSGNGLAALEFARLADLRSVRNLYVANNAVASIGDGALRKMRALLVLDASGNQLRTVSAASFAGLDALRQLLLASNRLETIADDAFAHLGQLRLLDLSGNRLTVLRASLFHPNAPLERLLLRGCRLVAVDPRLLASLRGLSELDLRANRLADGFVGRLQSASLRILDLSANNLTRLPAGLLDGLSALRELRVEDGRLALIEDGALLRTADLESFSVRRNRLRQLPDDLFRTTRRLRRLRLDENSLAALPPAVANLVSIRQLSVAANRIGDSDVCAALRALRDLTELNVSGNAIAAFVGLERCNWTRLVHLDLSANLLTALPESAFCGAASLRSVDLSANRFGRLPLAALARCRTPGVQRLVFENNPISRIGQGNRPDPAIDHAPSPSADCDDRISHETAEPRISSAILPLRELVVSGCVDLTVIGGADLDSFDRLVHLRLAGNAISRISAGAFQSLATTLTTLDLASNRIASLSPRALRGLRSLESLNVTRNALRALRPFCGDLKALRTLDLSHNRLAAIDRLVFRRLANLTELRLQGNRIATLPADAFRPLRNLRTLDIAGNGMRSLPLDAFRPLETRLRSLVLRETGLVCGCEQEETWQWLRDHEKLTRWSRSENENEDASNGSNEEDGAAAAAAAAFPQSALRCQEPAELRGRPFLQTELFAFCASPLLVQLGVHDVRAVSVNVSWRARDHSRLRAYRIVHSVVSPASAAPQNGLGRDDDDDDDDDDDEEQQLAQPNQQPANNDQSSGQLCDSDARWALVTRLVPSTRYSICVIGLGDERWPGEPKDASKNSGFDEALRDGDGDGRVERRQRRRRSDPQSNRSRGGGDGDDDEGLATAPALAQRWSRCVEMRTLDGSGRGSDDDGGGGNRGGRAADTLLTRRLGLIVGSCMGCVVFTVLVLVLVYTKMKKQRRNAKHQQPLPPEYLSYRHFSLQGCEANVSTITNNNNNLCVSASASTPRLSGDKL